MKSQWGQYNVNQQYNINIPWDRRLDIGIENNGSTREIRHGDK